LAYEASYKKIVKFGALMKWEWPYIPMDDPMCGMLRLLAYIDWLAYTEGLTTVSQIFSNTKMYFLLNIPIWFNRTDTGPWCEKGTHHPLIAIALKNLPSKPRAKTFAIPKEWIKSGFDLWSREMFISIFIIHGWVGRSSEFLYNVTSNHQLTWGMVEFCYVNSNSGKTTIMPNTDVLTIPCDMVRIKPKSKKHQSKGEVREIPPRLNFTKMRNPADGLKDWNGDMATIVQAHYITSQAFRCTGESLKNRPMLTMLNGKVLTAASVNKALKQMAVIYGENPENVSLHCLRAGRCTDLANGPLMNQPVTILATTSHKNLSSLEPYIRMDRGIAEAVTNAFSFLKR
jgi:hypothetical protein